MMRSKIWKLFAFLMLFSLSSCELLTDIAKDIEETQQNQQGLTNAEIISGLKEALNIGTDNAVGILSKPDGFYKDLQVKIPFPQEAQNVEDKLRAIGLNSMVDDFVENMNHGAEEAVKEATPIFKNAVTSMTFDDAKTILQGEDNAATEYFRQKTSAQLYQLFYPKVKNTLDQVLVTKYWSDIMTKYNSIPFVSPVTTDLNKYVTEKAMDGLFLKIADEELKIRKDPVARVTELLKKVFGSLVG